MCRGADRLSLLGRVAAALQQHGVPFALIGAAAMAVHGVSRSTRDIDLLALAPECLTGAFWAPLAGSGVEISIRRGDADDPLAGVVRFRAEDEHPVDLVVGKSPWQERVLTGAREAAIEDVRVPVANRVDLVLLKLYAGGPQDAWDIAQLLAGEDRGDVSDQVEARLAALPAECGRLWRRVKELEEGGR